MSHTNSSKRGAAVSNRRTGLYGYHNALLDSPSTASNLAWYPQNPSTNQVRALWDAFLANVHLVVKITFGWDKEPVMDKAAGESFAGTASSLLCNLHHCNIKSVRRRKQGHARLFDQILAAERLSVICRDCTGGCKLCLNQWCCCPPSTHLILGEYPPIITPIHLLINLWAGNAKSGQT